MAASLAHAPANYGASDAASPPQPVTTIRSWPGAVKSAAQPFFRGKWGWQLLIIGLGLGMILANTSWQRSPLGSLPVQFERTSAPELPAKDANTVDKLVLPPAVAAATPFGPEADLARAINASTPFAVGDAAPSAPFRAVGGMTDQERATDCLAAAGYYEAGVNAVDQRAVMQVVLNRVRHPAFPKSVCSVVFQGSELRTGCQFTFTCDGSMLRRQPSTREWRKAHAVALEMLAGRVEPSVGQATHYHTNWVHPVWSAQMLKIAALDTHLFFRWPGRSGAPQALGARYAGAEPYVSKMAGLSFAHATGADHPMIPTPTDVAQFVLPDTLSARRADNKLIASREPLPERAQAPDPDVFLVTLDGTADPDSFVRLAHKSCTGKETCRFLGWTNPARRAKMLPISGAAIDALSFSYIRQSSADQGKARWNCTEFPRDNQAQCLRRGA